MCRCIMCMYKVKGELKAYPTCSSYDCIHVHVASSPGSPFFFNAHERKRGSLVSEVT